MAGFLLQPENVGLLAVRNITRKYFFYLLATGKPLYVFVVNKIVNMKRTESIRVMNKALQIAYRLNYISV